jgi:hypothetical protein
LSSLQVILFAPVMPQQSALTEFTEQPLGSGLHVSPDGQLSQQMPFESNSWQWQTSPSGMQVLLLQPGWPAVQVDVLGQLVPLGALHVPRWRVVSKILQTTSPEPSSVQASGSPPQQSEFLLQRSPRTRQPPAGWQIVAVVLPNTPQ